jgi:hypothetical protein
MVVSALGKLIEKGDFFKKRGNEGKGEVINEG